MLSPFRACLAAALLFVAACSTGGGVSDADLPIGADRVVPVYRLGVADRLRVTVFGEENLSNEFAVGSTGTVAFPLIGEVQAAGLTTAQFQDALATRLREGYILEPRVSVEVLTYRPFYILGEVNTPGEYPYSSDLTVLNAVATAEGFTYRADTRRVFIRRAGEGGETAYRLTTTTPVAPGDTIRIGERFF